MPPLLDQVVRVVGEMMSDRGLPEPVDQDDPVVARFSEALSWVLWVQGYKTDPLPTVVLVCPTLHADAVGELQTELEENGKVRLIVVALVKITPSARSTLGADPNYEIFPGDFFKVNRYRNHMVPEMHRVNFDEVERFLKAKRITMEQLSRMNETEAVARYFDAKPGEVFKIRVRLGYLQPTWRYRVVVPAT